MSSRITNLMESLARLSEGLDPVPALDGAVCIGIDRDDNMLIFVGLNRHKVTLVYFVSEDERAPVEFHYFEQVSALAGDRYLFASHVGPHGDPAKDTLIKTWVGSKDDPPPPDIFTGDEES